MCLAIPGKVTSLEQQDGMLMGRVDFNGISKMVCLAYVPDVQIGQQVMVREGRPPDAVVERGISGGGGFARRGRGLVLRRREVRGVGRRRSLFQKP